MNTFLFAGRVFLLKIEQILAKYNNINGIDGYKKNTLFAEDINFQLI